MNSLLRPSISLPPILLAALASSTMGFANDAQLESAAPSIDWNDFDGDGVRDALILQAGQPARLLKGRKGGQLDDVSTHSGLSRIQDATSAIWHDVDLDGRTDLLLIQRTVGAHLMLQVGDGVFKEATAESQLDLTEHLVSASFFDYDGDGRADLQTVGLRTHRLFQNQIGGFVEIDLNPLSLSLGAGTPGASNAASASASNVSTPILFLPPEAGALTDQASPLNSPIQASSVATAGMLYPLGNDFFVDAVQGNVGIGNMNPATPLDVSGAVRSRVGGFIYPDGSVQSTATLVGPQGDTGPIGAQGPQGNPGMDGVDGAQGPIGQTGAQGPMGPQGIAGIDGVDGAQGPAGLSTPGSINQMIRHDGSDWVADNLIVNSGTTLGIGISVPDSKVHVSTGSASLISAIEGAGANGPTKGYLGARGITDYDSVASADWAGYEIGVVGISSGGTQNDNYGVMGHSNGVAVRGEHSSDPVNDWGELGSDGVGVRGSGTLNGVLGTSSLLLGSGVRGEGLANGVIGEASFDAGVGVVGTSTASAGAGAGVQGRSFSPSGTGVTGFNTSTGDHVYSPVGVYGFATATTNSSYGLYGEIQSAGGAGVYGTSQGADSDGVGVHGHSLSAEGYGVRGTLVSDCTTGQFPTCSGTGAGVLGSALRGWLGAGPDAIRAAGNFTATGAKAFSMPNPLNPEREVRFLCMEGNESGTYFRGTGQLMNGVAHIPVPQDFALVTDAEGLTVQITLVGGWTESWVESSDLGSIVVRGKKDLAFHYMVSGVRRGYTDYDTDHANVSYRPEVRDIPFGGQYPAEQRQMMVQSGMLNADFTPNEALIQSLGWTLREPTAKELDSAALMTAQGMR